MGLVAKRIGACLGLNEASVEENDMIGGSALTIGEYLSPRLYLSYGVGLFEPGEVIAFRYKLSEDVRIQRGSEETRAPRVPHREVKSIRREENQHAARDLIGLFEPR